MSNKGGTSFTLKTILTTKGTKYPRYCLGKKKIKTM